jgi:two-component system, sensor histidine kinase and response regulator
LPPDPADQLHVLNEKQKSDTRVPTKGTVLVAEDNEGNQKIILRVLEKAGYRVDLAKNGREAVNATAGACYDLILMDVQMPELDGFAAAAQIRRLPLPARDIPIVAMTANAMSGDGERCLSAGMDDYLNKPIRMEELTNVLRRWTNKGAP